MVTNGALAICGNETSRRGKTMKMLMRWNTLSLQSVKSDEGYSGGLIYYDKEKTDVVGE